MRLFQNLKPRNKYDSSTPGKYLSRLTKFTAGNAPADGDYLYVVLPVTGTPFMIFTNKTKKMQSVVVGHSGLNHDELALGKPVFMRA